jgi:asparagine synthase (glutamine-hydrolysing)
MCGIAGYWHDGKRSDLGNLAQAMTRSLQHRGPDGQGVWTDEEAGLALGHRRLSILDLSENGAQPFMSASGQTVLTFNGEIYNHLEIRQHLSLTTFRGTSDTETLAEAIDQWGMEATLAKLNGMFAFAVWDRSKRTLTVARDRLGIKPLYYWHTNSRFLFASELKSLQAAVRHDSELSLDIDRKAIALLMRHGYVPAPETIFSGVRKLLPGTLHTITNLNTASSPQPYWSLAQVAQSGHAKAESLADTNSSDARVSDTDLSDNEAIEELEELLANSIRLRTLADVPVGAFLSGGVDSSVVVALLQKNSPSPVSTFTVGFEQKDFDESQQARRFAELFGTTHHELIVTDEEARGIVPRLPMIYDEPFADSSQIPTRLISEFARQHVTVSLSGDGGDELFGGYRRYQTVDAMWSRLQAIPSFLRRAGGPCAEVLHRLLPRGLSSGRTKERLSLVADLIPSRDGRQFYSRHFGHWRRPDELVIGGSGSRTYLDETDRWRCGDDLLAEMMLADGMTYLPDDILTKLDRASMSVGLEARVPLLDHRVVEFAWRQPKRMRWRDGQTKWLLRQVLRRQLPEGESGNLDQPKRGFGVPLSEWLRGPLRDWAESLLDSDRLRDEGFLHADAVRSKWQEHVSGQREWHYWLWDVLMFQAWLENWSQSAAD